MAINVNRGVIDPFYRYKMPRLQAKVEGRGNGIKTVVANLTDIAKALDRPPMYVLNFFGCQLGTSTKTDKENERYIINGQHDANKLQDLLDAFIQQFVLCPACDNPETVLSVKGKSINSKCKACGHAHIVDPKNKLSNFIVKHPPPSSSSERKDNKQKHPSAEKKIASTGKTAVASDNDGDDDDWAPPLESEKNLPERLDLKSKASLLLVEVLFDVNILDQIGTYKMLLYRFLKDDSKAQRYFLGGIEQLIEKNKNQLFQSVPNIIQKLFDEDLVEEEVLLSWSAKPSSKYINKIFAKEIISCCQPVLKGLKKTQKKNDEVEIVFDERSRDIGTVSVKESDPNGIHKSLGAKAAVKSEDEDDELDIDGI